MCDPLAPKTGFACHQARNSYDNGSTMNLCNWTNVVGRNGSEGLPSTQVAEGPNTHDYHSELLNSHVHVVHWSWIWNTIENPCAIVYVTCTCACMWSYRLRYGPNRHITWCHWFWDLLWVGPRTLAADSFAHDLGLISMKGCGFLPKKSRVSSHESEWADPQSPDHH